MDYFNTPVVCFIFWQQRIKRKLRSKYIENYFFHKGIRKKISQKYPQLTEQQLDLVFNALKDYFQICLIANKKMVAMPSQIVDDAWHEFILSTRFYSIFCNKALGRFLHHTPTEAMSSPTYAQQAIKRSWRLACANEGINPKQPLILPLLFAIDGLLNIENGFIYQLNCIDANNKDTNNSFCASHIGCSSGCAGDSGSDSSGDFGSSVFGDSDSAGSDCGGGCGGD
mgnify:CR=1 FL=1